MTNATTPTRIAAIDAVIATLDAADPVLSCWQARRAEVAEEAAKTLKPGQVVRLTTMPAAKRVVVLSVAANGIWIRRTATDGEFARRGVEQVKERVSIKTIIAA